MNKLLKIRKTIKSKIDIFYFDVLILGCKEQAKEALLNKEADILHGLHARLSA